MKKQDVIKKEARLRRLLRKGGYLLKKSRIKKPNIDNHGGYMIVDGRSNSVVQGAKFELTLNQVEVFVK